MSLSLEKTDPDKYNPENWNAVVLYNLLYYVSVVLIDEYMVSIDDFYKEYIYSGFLNKAYGSQHATEIGKAYEDIKECDKNLGLVKFINRLKKRYAKVGNIQTWDIGDNQEFIISTYQRGLDFLTKRQVSLLITAQDFNNDNSKRPLTLKHNEKRYDIDSITIFIRDKRIERILGYANDAVYELDLDEINFVSEPKVNKSYDWVQYVKQNEKLLLDDSYKDNRLNTTIHDDDITRNNDYDEEIERYTEIDFDILFKRFESNNYNRLV